MKRIETEETTEALKPLFGTDAEPPFYDPNDLHVHNWYYGKLGIEEDPRIPTFSKNKMSVKNCVYCKVCHKIKLDFQSSVSLNKDIVKDLLYDVFESKFINDYIPNINDKIEMKIHECKNEEREFHVDIQDNLFMKPDLIKNNYVVIKTSSDSHSPHMHSA